MALAEHPAATAVATSKTRYFTARSFLSIPGECYRVTAVVSSGGRRSAGTGWQVFKRAGIRGAAVERQQGPHLGEHALRCFFVRPVTRLAQLHHARGG